jgi:hypothetical protein
MDSKRVDASARGGSEERRKRKGERRVGGKLVPKGFHCATLARDSNLTTRTLITRTRSILTEVRKGDEEINRPTGKNIQHP